MANNHFVDHSLLSMIADRESIFTTLRCLKLFYEVSRVLIIAHKNYYWIIGLDDPPTCILTTWRFVQPSFIVRYLGIPFRRDISPISMWDVCLERLQCKLLF